MNEFHSAHMHYGPFKCYVTQRGGGGIRISASYVCEGPQYNVISVTRC